MKAMPMMSRSTTVEFAGMPGVGKSTVCSQLIHQLRQQGTEVSSREDRERAIARAIAYRGRLADWQANAERELRHNARIGTTLHYMASFSPVARRGMVKPVRDLLRKSHLGRYVGTEKRELFVLDQGIIQPILSISILRHSTSRTPPALMALLEAFHEDLPDIVVLMKVDPDAAYDRLMNRLEREGPTGRFDRRLQSVGKSAYERGQHLTEEIVERIGERGATIVESDATQSPEQQADALAASLQCIQRSHQA